MLKQQTLDQLADMRLKVMLEAYRRQQEQPSILELSFEERFSLLVEYEWTARRNRHLQRLLKQAHLRIPACIEDIDYNCPRNLDRKLIARLSTGEWLQQHQNVLISGPTGVGKTYLSCALGNIACRIGYSTRYYRVSRLLEELVIAKGDGTYSKFLSDLKKIQLLILDDWGLNSFTSAESRELLEVVEDRNQQRSTIITSQLPVDHWNQILTDPTLADAILDRLVHNAYKISIKGESMRKLKAQTPDQSI
ncbi:AAA family ATPase [Thermoanaerobacteraceae bacterium SP2]|nr:AAA family ATPase [Thermoanaerobacteraceae bacterium SP2]